MQAWPPRTDSAPRLLLAVALVLGSSVLGACGRDSQAPLDRAILILLDTARPDRMSLYGHDRPTTPELERLAERAVVFEQAISHAPWTLPSMASILSGSPAREVFDRRLLRSEVQSLRNAGFRTAAVTEGGYLSSFYGFDLGFDVYYEERAIDALDDPGDGSRGIAHTFRLAREWIDAHRDDRFFLLIHTYEPHIPYQRRSFAQGMDPGSLGPTFEIEDFHAVRNGEIELTDAELAYLGALYDGGLLEADRHVGALLDHLEAIGLLGSTLLVLTSDHGEELGNHYRSRAGDHGHSLLDDELRVPLVIAHPSADIVPHRVTQQVLSLDIMPTILEFLGVEPHPRVHGRSLAPLMRGEAVEPRAAFGASPHSGPDRASIRYAGFKYVEIIGPVLGKQPLRPLPPPAQLYDLTADPDELQNLALQRPELVERFRAMLASDGSAGAITAIKAVDDTLRQRLEALGYVE